MLNTQGSKLVIHMPFHILLQNVIQHWRGNQLQITIKVITIMRLRGFINN